MFASGVVVNHPTATMVLVALHMAVQWLRGFAVLVILRLKLPTPSKERTDAVDKTLATTRFMDKQLGWT